MSFGKTITGLLCKHQDIVQLRQLLSRIYITCDYLAQQIDGASTCDKYEYSE